MTALTVFGVSYLTSVSNDGIGTRGGSNQRTAVKQQHPKQPILRTTTNCKAERANHTFASQTGQLNACRFLQPSHPIIETHPNGLLGTVGKSAFESRCRAAAARNWQIASGNAPSAAVPNFGCLGGTPCRY